MKKTYKIALSGILLALACGISWIEQVIPLPLPLGAKPGLASIIVMFAIFRLDFKQAFSITLLKSVFVLLTRAATAFFMSFSGGILSFAVMYILHKSHTKISVIAISTAGAVSHNIGQIVCAGFIMKTPNVFVYYAPILVITGCITGVITGIIAEIVLKYTKNSSNGGKI